MRTTNEITAPEICGVEITTDAEGRFNLNNLHTAAVANGQASDSQRPSNFIKSAKVKDFVQELTAATEIAAVKTINGGPNHGVWGLELVAIRYAAWLSPKFEIDVYQTFRDYRTGKLSQPAEHRVSQQLILSQQRQIELLEELLIRERENSQLRVELEEKSNHHQPLTNQELLRERDELAERLGQSRNYATIDAVERRLEREFGWHRLRNWCLRNNVEPLVLRKFQCVNAWPRGAWLAVYGVNLEELFG